MTPHKEFQSAAVQGLISNANVLHRTWRGFIAESLAGRRVPYAWPDRLHLNDLCGVEIDALAVIEWGESETAEWIEEANPFSCSPIK